MTTPSRPNDTTATGVSSTDAKDDHRHGRESWSVSPETLTISPFESGGSADSVPRGDHRHAWPAASPLGMGNWAGIDANTAAVTTETQVPGLSVTWGWFGTRLVKITFDGRVNASVAGDLVRVRIRENNINGAELKRGQRRLAVSGGPGQETLHFTAFVAITGQATVCVTLERASGVGAVLIAAEPSSPAWLLVEDVGIP